jgi:hypothetical protein
MDDYLENILLEDEQKSMLVTLVEAWRNMPPEKRQKFIFVRAKDGSEIIGLSDLPNPYEGDIEALGREGLLHIVPSGRYSLRFDITPAGFRYYAYLKQSIDQPVQQVEKAVRAFLEGGYFQGRYPDAYGKWAQAERILWSSDTEKQLTTIGHLCREAMQHFATALVERFQPAGVTKDVSKTITRISAVMEQHSAKANRTTAGLLAALLGYWAELNNLVQRQEHGAQKEGEPLKWDDARRVVFHTATVMYEIEKMLGV